MTTYEAVNASPKRGKYVVVYIETPETGNRDSTQDIKFQSDKENSLNYQFR